MTSENQKMQCTPQVLQFLMELRGKEVVKFIDREFNGYAGLAKALSSSPDKGENYTTFVICFICFSCRVLSSSLSEFMHIFNKIILLRPKRNGYTQTSRNLRT